MSQISISKNIKNPKSLNSRYYRNKFGRKVAFLTLASLPLWLLAGFLLAIEAAIALLILAVLMVVTLIIYRPIIGYFLGIFLAISIELFGLVDPLSPLSSSLYKSLSTFTPIPIAISGFEVLALLTFFLSWLRAFIHNEPFLQRSNLSYAFLGLALFCVVGLVYGTGRGGVLNIGIYELRGFVGMMLFYLMTCYHLKSFQHWKVLAWIIPPAIVVLSGFTFARWVLLGFNIERGPTPDSLNGANHSTVIFYLLLIFGLICMLAYGGWKGQIFTGLILFLPVFLAMLISGRRVAFAAMIFCMGFFGIILLVRKRKAAAIFIIVSVIVLVPYTAAFWNSDSLIAEPAQAIRSQISPKERDASSDLYRLIEKTNVHLTITATPLLGVGFGQTFYEFIPMINLDGFELLQLYTPHANFLWIWLKLGAGGFFVFCFMVGLAMFQIGQVARYGKEGPEFSLTVLAGIYIVSWLIYTYYDIGAVDARLMTLLGVAFGLIDICYCQLEGKIKVKKTPRSLKKASTKKLFQVELNEKNNNN